MTATVIVSVLDLASKFGVSVLGPLPQGLPSFSLPWITYDDPCPFFSADFRWPWSRSPIRAFSRTYAARTRTYASNQEMVGLGAANLAAGFFQGFPISSSSSRTPVAEAAGARTQITELSG